MLRIGITGGIGSGKTTVCKIFAQFGIPVYSADDQAKRLMVGDDTLVEEIERLFGIQAYTDDGLLNTRHISEMAFKDASLLQKLNALVHPAVSNDFREWSLRQTSPYVIKEAALMYESGSYRELDYVVTVSAPKKLRIKRSMERDGTTREQVLARLKKQWSENQRNEAADFIIKNDGYHPLIPQVQELHQRFLAEADKEV